MNVWDSESLPDQIARRLIDDGFPFGIGLPYVVAKVVREWLLSDAIVELAARASFEDPGPDGRSRWKWDDRRVMKDARAAWINDTRAGLTALAERIEGEL